MSDMRDWRRGDDWGRPYEDDPYWDYRGDNRDRRRESRDVYGDRGSWGGESYGRSSGDRDDWRMQSRRYDRETEPRGYGDWTRRGGARADERYDQGYGPRDPSRDPREVGRRSMGSNAPGLPWTYGEPVDRGERSWRQGYQPGPDYYGRRGYGEDRSYGRDDYRRGDRSWWDRASDEVSSWFGDDEATRRRQRDQYRDENRGTYFRGHGPRGYTRSDERIREDVSDRLTDNPVLDATDIEIAVSGGEVTLHGHVDSRYSKRLAEDLADEVSGVKHVQNNLRIRDTARQRDSISGTYSGIAEEGRTSDTGRSTVGSGTTGSTGTGNTSGSMTTSMARSGETTTGAKADRTSGSR